MVDTEKKIRAKMASGEKKEKKEKKKSSGVASRVAQENSNML